jgi:Ca2+-binding EF-hand superfamily protein
LVPGFGEESTATIVPGFGTDSSGGKAAASLAGEEAISESVREQVERVLNQYDRNDDDVLDGGEIENTPWGQPSPQESDLNGDGRLTRDELVERYRKRETDSARMNGDNDRRSSRRDSDDRRSDNRRSDDRRSEPSGERPTENPSPSSSEGSTATRSTSQESRIADYVQELLRQYDTNHDGSLSADEQSNMRSAPKSSADADSNGSLSRDELIGYYGGGFRQPSSDSGDSRSSETENSSNESRSFRERRRDAERAREVASGSSLSGDRPIKMHEFTDTWTDEKLEEFRKLDLNNDGVISVEEFRQRN